MKKVLMIFLILSLFIAACSQVQVQKESFVIGFIPAERASELTPRAEDLAQFLEQRMDREVEVVVPTSYEPLMEGLRFGHIDAAFMDSGPAWLAHRTANAEVVLAEVKDNSTFYYGEIFVRTESNITSLEEVIGKRIAFTSWTGSSGFILPIGTLVNEGLIQPEGEDFASLERALEESFESHTVAGGYKQALSMLVEGNADVAGGAHDAPERFLEQEDRDKLRTLTRLGKVPSHPVVVGEHVSDETREEFVNAMLELNQPEHNEILQDLYGVDGLVEADTQEHLGDFGPAFEALTGIQDQVLSKKS